MARLRCTATTEGEITLPTASRTILQLKAPTNQRAALLVFSVSFDGTSATAQPVQVSLVKQTSSAPGAAAATEIKDGPGSETIQCVVVKNSTADPGTQAVHRRYEVHPQSGLERVFGPDEEIIIAGGEYLGIVCNAPAAVNVTGHIVWEE